MKHSMSITSLLTLLKIRKFYLKLVGSMLVLAVLPLFIISTLLFLNTQKAFQNQINDANLRYLQQTENAFQIVKTQIDSSFLQLIVDNNIADYENYPDGKNLEKQAQSGDPDHGDEISPYLKAKDRVYNKLSSLRLSNRYIQSVYYYDRDKDLILMDSWVQYPFKEFYDLSWQPMLEGEDKPFLTWFIREANYRFANDEEVISVLLPSFKEKNMFLVNIDAERLYRHIAKYTNTEYNNTIFVLDRKGEPILFDTQLYNQNEFSFLKPIADLVTSSDTTTGSILSDDSLLTYVYSPTLEWTFVSRTNLDDLYQHVRSLQQYYLFSTLGILFFAILIVFFATRRLYSPILNLVKSVSKLGKRRDNSPSSLTIATGVGELKYIAGRIEESEKLQDRLEIELRESMPAYREKLVRSLLKPRYQNPDMLKSRFEFAMVDVLPQNVAAMVISVAVREEADGPEQASLHRLWIAEVIRNSIQSLTTGDVAETDDNWFVAIVNCDASQLDQLFLCAETIQKAITQRVESDCSIGLGTIQADINELHISYNEAVEALKHGMLAGNGEVVHIQDIRIGNVWNFKHYDDLIETLKDFVKSGHKEAAHDVIEEIYADLISQSKDGPYREIQKVLTKILIAFSDSIEDVGGDWKQVSPENASPFASLSRISDVREVFHWFTDLAERCADYISQARTTRNWCYADKVKDLIEQDCGRKVNLHWVAAELKLNPSYLGRIFKEQMGMNFLEYLTRIRVSKSKQLLLETDMTVEEIGNTVGYSNSYYFIKLFREHTGTTPGKYRKSVSETE